MDREAVLRAQPAARRWTPTSVHEALGEALGRAGFGDVWVGGTLTGLRRSGRWTGAELVDYGSDGAPSATLAVAMFGADAERVLRRLRGPGPVEGERVRLRGRLEPDARFGRVRLVAADAEAPQIALAPSAREQVLAGLREEGRLGTQRRLDVPPVPTYIGLVSGPGAGREDLLAVLASVGGAFTVEEATVPLGGPRTPGAVQRALGHLTRARVEVILIARGGGARSELAVWDSVAIARAIVGCRVPVWTALGHQRDRSVADEVANAAFATPTAAGAELVRRVELARRDRLAAEEARSHQADLAAARRRLRVTVLLATLVVVLVVLFR